MDQSIFTDWYGNLGPNPESIDLNHMISSTGGDYAQFLPASNEAFHDLHTNPSLRYLSNVPNIGDLPSAALAVPDLEMEGQDIDMTTLTQLDLDESCLEFNEAIGMSNISMRH
jgi:hypothetical protein